MKHISESITESIIGKRGMTRNPYGLTKKDLIGDLEKVPMGVVVRMMEEQEAQGNKPNVKVFQRNRIAGIGQYQSGFNWDDTLDGEFFWGFTLNNRNYDLFFERYPEYRKYNI